MSIKNYQFLIIFVLFLASCSKNEEQSSNTGDIRTSPYKDHPLNERYQKLLDNYQKETKAPGCLMLVSRAGYSTWIGSNGTSNLNSKETLQITSQFRIGSISKIYVAAYILRLVDLGVLQLDDQLVNLLPEIAAKIPGANNVKVRHLLGHLSGIIDPSNESNIYKTDLINDPIAFGKLKVPDLLNRYVYGQPLHFSPGSEYRYSNTGYWLLGLIAEKIKKASLQQLLANEFFVPLKLTDTYLEKKSNPNVANGYGVITGSKIMDVNQYDIADGDGKSAGGIISSAGDVGSFMSSLFNGRILSAQMMAEMKKIQLPECGRDECRYGLGMEIWDVKGLTAYGHNGSSVGYESNTLYFENTKTLIVLFKNIGGGSDKSFLYDIAN